MVLISNLVPIGWKMRVLGVMSNGGRRRDGGVTQSIQGLSKANLGIGFGGGGVPTTVCPRWWTNLSRQ